MPEELLAADAGYAGPRAACGKDHAAAFASYRDKSFDCVLGTVRIRRAWYHCQQCGRGFAPRDGALQAVARLADGRCHGIPGDPSHRLGLVDFVGPVMSLRLAGSEPGRRR